MSFGKIYGFKENPRTRILLVIAKENGLDIELVETYPPGPEEYAKVNPLRKIPTFVGSNGFVLTECIAIAIYLVSQNEKTTLLGKSKEDYAAILRWMSWGNSEFISVLGRWFRPLIGKDPYIKKSVDEAVVVTTKLVDILEEHLLSRTFLVTEKLTLADLFVASIASRGFQFVFDAAFRQAHPTITRWFELIVNQPVYKNEAGEPIFIEEAVKYTPPKKEEKKKEAPKPAPKAEKKAEPKDDEEEEAAPAEPKPKHPLDHLPKATLTLDDWKRKYSNEDTRSVALPWLWEHYKPEEYSLWKVDYKYNDELTLTFMTSNLIGGFFNRLEASRKHLFGALSVYGESSNSIVSGAFLVRGQDHLPAFDVAPDWESYEFTKLDPTKLEDRAFVEDQWAWDKDYQGKKWADGKVFK
ncbi:elongation factor EF-1 gamma subunit [Kalaharituber pfeilii]|nr:elongation factor EF-1 gamma subunit [Kalaharituber pfeilii]